MAAGEAVDRPPFTLYQRWPVSFMSGESLATMCYAFAEHMQLDLVVVPLGFGYPLAPQHSFDRPVDLSELEKVHGNSGVWGKQIHALQRVVKANFGKRWVLQEVPSPWTMLEELAGRDLVLRTLREYSGFLRRALEALSDSLASFVRYAVESGAQGILYRNSQASFDIMTHKEYALWGEPFDAKVAAALRGSTFNVAQFVGPKPYLRDLAASPFQAIGWSVVHGPKLENSPSRWEGPLFGGLDETRFNGSLATLRSHTQEVLRDGPLTNWLLSSGEPVPPDVMLTKLEALRDAVLQYRIKIPRADDGSAPNGAELRKPRKRREEYERPAPPQREAPKPVPGARTRIVGSKAPEEAS